MMEGNDDAGSVTGYSADPSRSAPLTVHNKTFIARQHTFDKRIEHSRLDKRTRCADLAFALHTGMSHTTTVSIVIDLVLTDEELRLRFAIDRVEALGELHTLGFTLTSAESAKNSSALLEARFRPCRRRG